MSGIGIWVALVAVALASCAQGLTGFGFSVVAVPLLLLVFPPSTVIVIALVLSLVLTVTLLPKADGEIQPMRTWPLFAFSLAGAVGGGLLLPHLPKHLIAPLMGVLAFAGGIAVLLSRRAAPFRREGLALAATGVVSGFMNATASLSGPAVAMMTVRQGWDPKKARKTLLAYSAFVNGAALLALAPSGLISGPVLLLAARLLPAVAVGRMLGQHGSARLPARGLRWVTLGLVLACGFASAARGVAAELH